MSTPKLPLGDRRRAATTDDTTALLIRARGFIERGWCQGANAKDKNGQPVSIWSDQAVAWCAAGALFAAGIAPDHNCWEYPVVVNLANNLLQKAIGRDRSIQAFNDRQWRVRPVLAAFDRAIALAEMVSTGVSSAEGETR